MTVRNFRKQNQEIIQYITPVPVDPASSIVTVTLHDPPTKSVLFYEGDGLPSLTYSTTRGPLQHGYSVLGVREPEREINMVVRWNACSRDDYWTMRHEFVDIFRPNRTNMNNPSPGVLRRVLSNGEIYDLDVYLTAGPQFVFPAQWDHFSFQESLTFIAYNPVMYKPDDIVGTVTDFLVPGVDDIVYGFTFEFTFADTDPYVARAFNVVYDGNWETYPIFEITGPWTHILIGNQETGEKLEIDGYASPALEITTIDLTYGVKTIFTDSSVSLLRYLTTDSNLGTFSIQPNPTVAGGVNTIAVAITGGTADTTVEMTYKERFISI